MDSPTLLSTPAGPPAGTDPALIALRDLDLHLATGLGIEMLTDEPARRRARSHHRPLRDVRVLSISF